ncbi:SdpI family protein [Mucilaginibacter terrigena]|uniref:SdpI family protein n=1 Tax=Mucilaginibacter terrigena TaxID=2492395 RepID=A0A4Q5LL40_9SPHI|nr:SdpI family protein [Mucilaginibacter terrigena]RYU89560.1 SdpI family protein [Mucilaginibacter terrigena]
MIFVNWIIGPHLIGLIFILAGLIQKRYPPKKINSLYGYRTTRSMKNQQNWDEGNSYSTRLMIKCGLILFVAGIIITFGLMLIDMTPELRTLIKAIMMVVGGVGTAIVLFVVTERHLKRTFHDTL